MIPVYSNFLKELNSRQYEVVVSNDYPMMIIAGAGSGKTKTLVTKIAYLISAENVDPYNILALTFTNKAAEEMRDRIKTVCGAIGNLMIGTFHSCFLRLLQREHDRIGFGSNFIIYDTTDSKTLLKHIVADLKFDNKVYDPKILLSKISFLKSKLITPDKYLKSDYYSGDKIHLPKFDKIYSEYVKACRQNNAMDFDDILVYTYTLFKEDSDVLKKYQDRFKYVFIDEFQDTNVLQSEIIKLLTKKNKQLCVVGDDAQSIYGFRGATIENILNFQKDYTNSKIFKLEQNYRSTKNIISAANSVIDKNKNQIKKTIWTDNEEGDKCCFIKALTDNEEAKIVTNLIQNSILSKQLQYSDVAVLFRTNNQATNFEIEMSNQKVPYKTVGNLSFYQRKEIKDFIGYLRVIVNQNDDESWKRIINSPKRGIGDLSMERIFKLANENNVHIWEILDHSPVYFEIRLSNLIQEFLKIIRKGIECCQTKNAYEIAQMIFNELYDKISREANVLANIKTLMSSISDFVDDKNEIDKSLYNYISKTPLTNGDKNDDEDDINKVSLMTVHTAKGLEFKHVYIVGVEEKMFPSEAAINTGEVEDERRLFYVAMTRAKEKLYISYVMNRFLYGNMISTKKSRFLDEINPSYVDPKNITKGITIMNSPGLGSRLYKHNYTNYDYRKTTFEINSKVYYPLFSKYGTIKNKHKVNDQMMFDIQFDDEKEILVSESVLSLFNIVQ